MAKKKTPTRKTTKKSGAKKKATKSRVTKTSAAKSSAPRKRRASVTPTRVGKKSAKKKSVAKKTKEKKKWPQRRKKSMAERVAEQVSRPKRRKPTTGGRAAKSEILEFFGSEDVSSLSPAELQERKLAFLRAYANRGIVRDGCLAADVSWGTYTRWREKDEGFSDGCKHAEMLAADRLEGEAHRRAFEGYEKPVIYQGEITETYTEYSDSLMQTLMKGYKREKYKERQEHSTPVGQPMQLDVESKDSVVSSILAMIKNKPDPA